MSQDSSSSRNPPQLTLWPTNGHKISSKKSTSTSSEGTAVSERKPSRRSSWKDGESKGNRASSDSSPTEPVLIVTPGAASETTKSSRHVSSISSGDDRKAKEPRSRSGRSPPKPLTAVSDDGGPDARPRAKAKKYPAPVSTAILSSSSRSRSDLRSSSGQSPTRGNQSSATTTTPEVEALMRQVKALELSIRNEFASFNGRQFGSLLDLVGRLKNTLQPQTSSSTGGDLNKVTYIAPQVSSEPYMRLGREYQDAGTQTTVMSPANAHGASSGESAKHIQRDDLSRPRKSKIPTESRRQVRTLSRTPPHKNAAPEFSVIRIGGGPDAAPETWHSHLDLLRSLDDSEEELRRDTGGHIAVSPSHLEQRRLAGPCPIEMLQGEDDNSAKSDEAASRDSPIDNSLSPSPRKSWTSSARWTISPRQPSPMDDNRSCEESSEGGDTPSDRPDILSATAATSIKPSASPVPDVQCPTSRRPVQPLPPCKEDLPTNQTQKLSLPLQSGSRSAFAPKRVTDSGAS